MNHYKNKSLEQFVKSDTFKEISKDDLVISDVDGVFFKGIFDLREIVGLINPKVLKVFEELLETKTSFWIMTNRITLFKYFPFIKQLAKSIKKITNSSPKTYSSSEKFLKDELPNYAIIMNARKPTTNSQKVIEKGIENFSKVFYFAARDLPFYFNDLKLVENLSKNTETNKLTFIEITNHPDTNRH